MSFWSLSDGENAAETGKEYDAGGGNFDVIPKGTSVLAMVSDVAWKAVFNRSEQFVNVKWNILKPEVYANRVIFQKLYISDDDPNTPADKMAAKRDKHKRLLMAIDANSKGKLAKMTSKPDDDDLALALTSAQMVLTLGVWDKEESGQKVPGGNWVMKVAPKSAGVSEVAKPAARPVASRPTGGGHSNAFDADLEDDVPFISSGEYLTYRRVI